jgi:hypothetical protein
VRFEVCLPHGIAAKAQILWQAAGVRLVTDAPKDADLLGAGGTMWSVTESLLLSGYGVKAARDCFMPLPLLLLCFVSWCLQLLCRLLRRLLFGNSKKLA